MSELLKFSTKLKASLCIRLMQRELGYPVFFMYCELNESSLDLLESTDLSRSDLFLVNFFCFCSSKNGTFLAVFSAVKINF
jgi:hypothetical protein